MRHRAALLPLFLALPLTAAAHKDPLAGRTVAGPAAHCIDTFPSQDGPTAIARDTIVYRQNARRLWISHPQGSCPALGDFVTLIVERREGSQLCDTDRFRVLAPGETIPSPFCRFGMFTPYDEPLKR